MIAVVADDLTGAAELGGIGLRYNLHVEINTEINPLAKTDLLIVATDTRSKKKHEAEIEMAKVTRALLKLKPDMIFKKIDSVLRGHILPEITAQLNELDMHRALIVPANPALGRTLFNGTYFFNGQPIHLSSFSKDPEFAITTSQVLDMLGANSTSVQLQKNQEPMRDSGIIIGEARSADDLKAWARRIDRNTLIAGASGFFSALLDTINIQSMTVQEASTKAFGQPALYVCGSTFNKSRHIVKNEKINGGPVSYMPEEIVTSEEATEAQYEKWSHEVVSYLHTHGKAIVSIDPVTTEGAKMNAGIFREKTAQVVKKVCQQINIQELLLEGGSTASAVLSRLGLHRFYPIQEIAPGVVRMSVEGNQDLCLTLKPGSYDWPADIWKFNKQG